MRENARIIGKRDAFSDSGLSSASWIWLAEPDLLTTAPTGNVASLKTFATPTGKTAASAQIAMTVDNNFTLWVNGQPVAASDPEGEDGWKTAQVLSAALNASANVISVLAANANPDSPGAANPAGLLAAVRVFFTDGSNETILSDNTWLVSGTVPADFPLPVDVSPFGPAEVATQYGSGPWGTSVGLPSPAVNPLNLTGSSWIWNITDASSDSPAETVGFRKTVVAPSDKTASSATVLLSADNSFDLYVNGQYIGSPPFDNNAPNTIGSWEYAQRFTVTLTPSTNVFTVFAKNFPSQQTGAGSSAGFIAALQIKYTDGSSDIVRTDTTWLTGPFTSASSFLATSDSNLGPSILQGSFGIAPWGQIGISDALNVLKLPGNNAAAAPPPTTTTTTHPLPASTNNLPTTNPFTPSNPPSPSPSPTTNGAQATINSRALLLALPIIAFFIF